jgi:hypothetical protein
LKLNQTIKRVIAVLLICIFAISITPVFFIHTLFAAHDDNRNSTKSTGYQLTAGGFNCRCDDFVAEGQFLNDASIISIISTKNFSVYNHFFFTLRGPPTIVV